MTFEREMMNSLTDEIEQLRVDYNEAVIDGANGERAKIVAWLIRETKEYAATDYGKSVRIIRKAIEAGEHLK